MEQSAQELMVQKNYFYRDNYRRVIKFIILLVLLAICLSIFLGYLTWRRLPVFYYASTTTGEVTQLHPLSEPVISTSHLIEWAGMVGRKAYTLSFLNYQQQLDAASKYFTPGAWQKFLTALNSTGLLNTIKDKKVIMQTVVMSTPNVLYSGVVSGRFTWRVTMPILVTYGTASQQVQNQLNIIMNISRVPVLDTPEGILVTDFFVSTGATENPSGSL